MGSILNPTDLNEKIRFTEAKFIWFELWNIKLAELSGSQQEGLRDGQYFYSMYDYDVVAGGKLQFYVDTGIRLIPKGEVLSRSCFEAIDGKIALNELLDPVTVRKMVEWSALISVKAYMDNCTMRNIPFPGLKPIHGQSLHAIVDDLLETISLRLSLERSNPTLMKHEGFWARTSEETWLCLVVPFLVMDQLLYFYPSFDRKLNTRFFFQIVPEPVYTTVKMKCIAVQKQKVTLTLYHTYHFLLCLDCALQLMSSPLENQFLPALEKRKVDQQARQLFKKEGAVMAASLKRLLIRSGVQLKMENLNFDFKSFIR
jgi:hypothetical protein